jgi:lysophospholipase L1-like esterase
MISAKAKACCFIAIAFTVLLLLSEIVLFYARPPFYELDSVLGWRLRSNLNISTTQKALDGEEYNVLFETNAEGLRTFGPSATAPIQILVLGDSFTADATASNDQMWYSILVKELSRASGRPLEDFYVLAGGGGGYGTYQNVLLAERLSNTVNATVLIHQFCDNDFVNAHYEWESEGNGRTQYMLRPYATIGVDTPQFRPGFVASTYRSVLGRSRIFNKFEDVIQTMQYRWYGDYSHQIAPEIQSRYEEESLALTRHLLARLRAIYAKVPAVMVNCSGEPIGLNKLWTTLAEEAGFTPLTLPSDVMLAAKTRGEKDIFRVDGAHFSEKGNRLYGAALAKALLSDDSSPFMISVTGNMPLKRRYDLNPA